MHTQPLELSHAPGCPRCGSKSLIRSHTTIACLPCGHVLEEPEREPWDHVALVSGAGRRKVSTSELLALAAATAGPTREKAVD